MNKRMIQMLAVAAAVVALLGFVKFQQIRAAIAAAKSFQPPPEAVTTVVAREQPWQQTVEAVGNVAPVQGVLLSADEPGIVAGIEFESGAHVKAGETLVTLDTRQERAQLAAAEAQHELSLTSFDRARQLFAQQLIARSEYDQVSAQLKQAVAIVNEMKATIARKTITAPFAGIAGIRQVNLGQYVRSGDPVVPLQSLDPVYVDFAVPQQQLHLLHAGDTVWASFDSATTRSAGRITAVNPVVDDATRNVQIQATFRNPDGQLRPGMYVTVTVGLGASHPVIALPASAISYAPYGNSIFVVENLKGPDGRTYRGIRQQFVRLGASRGDQVAVLDGVRPGQEVVSSGVFKLRAGEAVMVNNAVRPSNDPAPRPPDS
jgi:membrane fusion protein (multidrug efflux system)